MIFRDLNQKLRDDKDAIEAAHQSVGDIITAQTHLGSLV